jgi:hypothetical protein
MELPAQVHLGNACGPNGKYALEHGRCLCDKGYFPWSDESYHPKVTGEYSRYFANGERGETFPACIKEATYGEVANTYLLGKLKSLGGTSDEIRQKYLETTDHVLAATAPGETAVELA